MNNIIEIFSSRIKKEQEKRTSYNKYIFNSHLLMFLLITAGAVMLNYSKWLQVATNIELKLVLSFILLIMAYFLTTIKVKTFIYEADTVLLLPLENKYKEIINKLLFNTIIFKLVLVIIFLGSLYPIITKLNIDNANMLLFGINLLIIIYFTTKTKYIRVIYSELSLRDLAVIYSIYVLTITIFVFTSFINVMSILAILFLYKQNTKNNNINWYSAADYDKERNERYLKFINMFVDVPLDIVKVSRRKYFDIFLPKLNDSNFSKQNSYNYYYSRAFLRQENTIFLVLRLLLIAVVISVSLDNVYASLLTIIAFNYLTVIQLTPIYKKLNSTLWFYILPIGDMYKKASFLKLIMKVTTLATVTLGLINAIFLERNIFNFAVIIGAMLIGLLLNYYFLKRLK